MQNIHTFNFKPITISGARFAFDIYDFEGKARMDLFYLGDVLRGLNLSPTLHKIEELGGTKKKGEKFIKLEEFYPIYSKMKAAIKDMGSFEDFVECCKLYDKQENGTMMLGELEHILLNLGKLVLLSVLYHGILYNLKILSRYVFYYNKLIICYR